MMVTAGGVTRTHVYTYDNIYQVTGVDYPPELSYLATDSTFNYDAAGNRTSVIDGSGTCTYTANNLNEYTAAGPTSYTYDDSGNMTADGTYTYDYDPENRLIRVHQSGSWSPPSLGQALDSGLTFTTGGADEWTTTYAESKQGWYSARSGYLDDEQESWLQTQVEGSGTVTFWWKVSSEEGSDYLEFWLDGVRQSGSISGSVDWEQKSFTVGAGTHTFKWRYSKSGSGYAGDDCGYVDWVQWSGSCPPAPEPDPTAWLTLAYRYDAAGRRVQKQYDNMTVTKYVYDGDHCIAEYDSSNVLRRKYIYGPCVDEPISMIEAAGSYAGTYYYHFDGLGSVVGLTNSSGNTVEVYEYDVYGRLGASDASHPNRLLFTGREYDKETGLYYYRARYYNPQIGRFLQTDPVGYNAGMNWYTYCGNNSTNGVDPSGMISGYFLDSDHGLLRYQMTGRDGELGAIFTFSDDASEDALTKWKHWARDYDVACGVDETSEVGWELARGDAGVFWDIQALIALGFPKGVISELEAAKATISTNSDHIFQEGRDGQTGLPVIEWDPSGDLWTHEDQRDNGNPPDWVEGFPALAILAHELTHGYRDIWGQMVGYGNREAEQQAMMAENEIAYAFYKKVPGYGNGGAHFITGPRTYYWTDGMSRETGKAYDDETLRGMKWDSWNSSYVPAW
jgi:RHS repeat-associated protein